MTSPEERPGRRPTQERTPARINLDAEYAKSIARIPEYQEAAQVRDANKNSLYGTKVMNNGFPNVLFKGVGDAVGVEGISALANARKEDLVGLEDLLGQYHATTHTQAERDALEKRIVTEATNVVARLPKPQGASAANSDGSLKKAA